MVVILALGWSMALGVFGLWLLFGNEAGISAGAAAWTGGSSASVRVSGGIVSLIGSQVVFLLCIADRVYPRAHPRMTRTIELVLGAIFLVGACVLGGAAMIG